MLVKYKHVRLQTTVKAPDYKTTYEVQGSTDGQNWYPLDMWHSLPLATSGNPTNVQEIKEKTMFMIHDQHVNFYHRLTVAMEILMGGTQPILERIERVRYVMSAIPTQAPFAPFRLANWVTSLRDVKTTNDAEAAALTFVHILLDQFRDIHKENDDTIDCVHSSYSEEIDRMNEQLIRIRAKLESVIEAEAAALKQVVRMKKERKKLKDRIDELRGYKPKTTRRTGPLLRVRLPKTRSKK